jgi:hypothetical protein
LNAVNFSWINWKKLLIGVAIYLAISFIVWMYQIVIGDRPGNCNPTDSFPDSFTCHFK